MTVSTSKSERVMVDTNVLVYAVNTSAEHHTACNALLQRAQSGSAQEIYCVTTQILAELYAVVTKKSDRPIAPADAVALVRQIVSMPGICILSTPGSVINEMLAIVEERDCLTGARVFDAQIVAVMQREGIDKIYSYDQHMKQFRGIQVLSP